MNSSTPYSAFVGIDVAKLTLDIHVLPGDTMFSCQNSADGLTELLSRLQAIGLEPASTLVVLEASGGYQAAATSALAAAGFAVAPINPQRVRSFAKSLGVQAKTDSIDARMIAEFALRMAPEPRPLASEQQQNLEALVARRRQIVEMITSEKNRLRQARPSVDPSIKRVITYLQQQLAELEQEIDTLIQSTEQLRDKDDLLQSFKGVGPAIARTLIVCLCELGMIDGKKLSALVGVAPFNHDSGRFSGRRYIRGGRGDVRAALFMAAKTAARWNPVIKELHTRLTKAGKPYRVVMIACARKILLILNAMVKNNQRFGEFAAPVAP